MPTKKNYFELLKYPIDDGRCGFHGSVYIQSTKDLKIRSRQIELYLYLVRNIKYILSTCSDKAYNLIKKNKDNPFVDSHLIESLDTLVDETTIDSITITSKGNILLALRIFAGYWTPEYRIKVNDDLTWFLIKKV